MNTTHSPNPISEQHLKLTVDKDRLSNAERAQTMRLAVRLVDAIDDNAPASSQIMAVASVMKLLLDVTDLDPNDLMAYAGNLMTDSRHSSRYMAQAAGLRWHIANYLMGKAF